MIDNLQFKYSILEAKSAAKQAELDEAKNEIARLTAVNSQAVRQEQNIGQLETKLAAAGSEIRRLQKEQLTDTQKTTISRSDWLEKEMLNIKNSKPQKEIAALTDQLGRSQADHRETLQKHFDDQELIGKLNEQIKSLKYQTSSPYVRQIRDHWKNISIGIGVVLAVSLLINIWLATA